MAATSFIQRKAMLLDMPAVFVALFCSQWLDVKSLANLDTACISASARAVLLNVFRMEGFYLDIKPESRLFKLDGGDRSRRFAAWLFARAVSVTAVQVSKDFISQCAGTAMPINRCTFRRLTSLETTGLCVSEATEIASDAPFLRELIVEDLTKTKDRAAATVAGNACPHLTRISVFQSKRLYGNVLSPFNCRKLETLSLTGCSQISKEFVKQLELSVDPTKLLMLVLSDIAQLSDSRLARLLNFCSGLNILCIDRCPLVTAQTLAHIGQSCQQLTDVEFTMYRAYMHSPTVVTAEDDIHIACFVQGCSNIKRLKLSHLRGMTDEGWKAIVVNLPTLEDLDLQHCNSLLGTGTIVLPYAQVLPLRKINIAQCRLLKGCLNLAAVCSQLTDLQLIDNDELSFPTFTNIFKHATKVTNLSIFGGCKFYGLDLDVVPTGQLPLLIDLNLKDCFELTDDGVAHIARICPNLQFLQLNRTAVANHGLEELARHCGQLQLLGVEECADISYAGLLALLAHCTSLLGLRFTAAHGADAPSITNLLLSMAALKGSRLRALYVQNFPGQGRIISALTTLLDAWPALQVVQLECYHENDYGGVDYEHLSAYCELLRRAFPQRECIICDELDEWDAFQHRVGASATLN